MFSLTDTVNPVAMIGTNELLIVAGVAVLLFGGSKLPELMRGMGQGIREFKSATSEAATVSDTPAPTATHSIAASQTVPQETKAATREALAPEALPLAG